VEPTNARTASIDHGIHPETGNDELRCIDPLLSASVNWPSTQEVGEGPSYSGGMGDIEWLTEATRSYASALHSTQQISY
jgi:hypothetical protein